MRAAAVPLLLRRQSLTKPQSREEEQRRTFMNSSLPHFSFCTSFAHHALFGVTPTAGSIIAIED